MSTVDHQPLPDQQPFPDEPPTKPADNVPSRTLIRWARVDRLASVAIERLSSCTPDVDALAAALADLWQIRALASEVLVP